MPTNHVDHMPALEARLAAATEKDVLLGMFIESSLQHIRETEGTAVADARRREVFGKRSVLSFFRYPVGDLLRLLHLSLTAAGSGQDVGAAIEQYGRAAVRIFFDSPLGKTMLALASADAQRMLSVSIPAYKAVTSFGERQYRPEGECSGVMTVRNDLLGPAWQVGVIREALGTACSVNVEVEIADPSPTRTDYALKIRW